MPPRLLRPGHITPEQIEAVIGVRPELPEERPEGSAPRVSGSLDAHYAPLTPMRVVASGQLQDTLQRLKKEFPRLQFGYYNRTKENFHPPGFENGWPIR